MGVYIELRDTDNSISGVLEVGNDNEAPLALTKKLNDYKVLNARSGVYSADFKIPLTKANAELLPSVYDANLKDTKNFFKRKDALIFESNGTSIMRGKISLLNIETNKGVKYLKLQFKADNLNWVTDFSELSLNEINWVDSSFNYDSTSVKDSWTNTADDSDFVFSAINRGQLLMEQNTWITRDFRPDLFVKRILDNAFRTVGFNLESAFFDTSSFKSLILPYFGTNTDDWKHEDAEIVDRTIKVGNTSATTAGPINGYEERQYETSALDLIDYVCNTDVTVNIPLNIVNGAPYQNPDNIYNYSTRVFENFNFFGDWNFTYSFSISSLVIPFGYSENDKHELYFEYQNPNSGLLDRQLLHTFTGTGAQDFNGTVNTYVDSVAGGVARFYLKFVPQPQGIIFTTQTCELKQKKCEYNFNKGCMITAEPEQTITYGVSLALSNVLSKKYMVLSLVNDLTKMFNLYWRTNNATKTVYCEPRDDFYQNITTATDLTDKIDLSKPYTLTDYASIYKNKLSFSYAIDSNDKYLKEINKQLNGQGSANWAGIDDINLGDKFEDGTKDMKHERICATHYHTNGYRRPWTARMWQEWSLEAPAFSTDFEPRILSYNYATQTQGENNATRVFRYFNESTATVEEQFLIPFALDRSIIRNGVLEAEVKQVLTYDTNQKDLTTDAGLVKDFYSGSVQSLKDGKNLLINIVLSLNDFKDIDFRKPIYFSAPSEISGYWYFENISNMPVKDGLKSVKVSLNKLVNYEALTVARTEKPEPILAPVPYEPVVGGELWGESYTKQKYYKQIAYSADNTEPTI